MRYPVVLTPDDNQTVVVTFPDVPGAITYGDTVDEALARAPDALLTVFDALIKDRRDIPAPSPTKGPSIVLPALESAKLALYGTLRAPRVSKAELGRRLDWHPTQVDRLLDPHARVAARSARRRVSDRGETPPGHDRGHLHVGANARVTGAADGPG